MRFGAVSPQTHLVTLPAKARARKENKILFFPFLVEYVLTIYVHMYEGVMLWSPFSANFRRKMGVLIDFLS
jgi:hypothetical protein